MNHNHRTYLHRDELLPWCDGCGLTESRNTPERILTQQKLERMYHIMNTGLRFTHYVVKPDNQKAVEVTRENMSEIARWCGGSVMEKQSIEEGEKNGALYIPTLSGPIMASVGDIVAQDDDGKFNVFDKDIFLKKYQKADVRKPSLTYHNYPEAPYMIN